MLQEGLFYLVILLSNIIQGITGFAGTILAMPFGIMLVGYDVAKPVLNVLGLLSGVYVFVGNREHVRWKEFRTVILAMAVGIAVGMGIRHLLQGAQGILYLALGVFVILLAVQGLYRMRSDRRHPQTVRETKKRAEGIAPPQERSLRERAGDAVLLLSAGVAHGIFVSGGPLLIGYLTKRVQEKEAFRATISTVWIVLNTMILVSDVVGGMWTPELMRVQLISVVPLLAGMAIGSALYRIMSRERFMTLTYLLLFVSGVTLLMK